MKSDDLESGHHWGYLLILLAVFYLCRVLAPLVAGLSFLLQPFINRKKGDTDGQK